MANTLIEINSCICSVANFLDVIVGHNDDYRCIRDGIYESMGQVSKENLAEDREAERRASQSLFFFL